MNYLPGKKIKHSDKIRILHFIPGRVRLKISKKGLTENAATILKKQLLAYPGIRSVHITLMTSSILIHFEKDQVTITRILQQVIQLLDHYVPVDNAASLIPLPNFKQNPDINQNLPGLAFLGMLFGMFKQKSSIKPEILFYIFINRTELKNGFKAITNYDRKNPDYYFFLSALFSIVSGHSKYRLAALLIRECTSALANSLNRKSDFHFQKYFPEIPDTIERLNSAGLSEPVPSIDIQSGDRVFYHKNQVVFTDSKVIQGIANINPHIINQQAEETTVKVSDSIRYGDRVKTGRLLVKVNKPPYNSWLQVIKHKLDYSDDSLTIVSGEENAASISASHILQAAFYFLLTRDLTYGFEILSSGYSTGLKRSSNITGKHLVASCLQNGALISNRSTLIDSFQQPVILMDNIHSIFEERYRVRSVLPVVIDAKPSRILELAGACEDQIDHPMADAITIYRKDNRIALPTHSSSIHVKGYGTETVIDEMIIRTGNRAFMEKRDIATHMATDLSDYMESKGWQTLFVSVDKRVFGVIGLEKVLNRKAKSFINAIRRNVTDHCYILSETGAWYREIINRIVPNNKYLPRDIEDFLAMLKRQQVKTTVLTTDDEQSGRFTDATHVIHLGKNNISDNLEQSHTCLQSENLSDLYRLLAKSKCSAKLINQNLNSTLLFHILWFIFSQNGFIQPKWNPVLKETISLLNFLNVHRISLISAKRC